MKQTVVARRSAFEAAYSVVVAVKGFDGVVELVLGVLLLTIPSSLRALLLAVAGELGEGGSGSWTTAAGWVTQAGHSVGAASTTLAVFFAVHGVVKLLTVYCLLRRLVRWYPVALTVLAALTVVQSVEAVSSPGIGSVVLVVLDVAVVGLVGWEYRRLRRDVAAAVPA